MRKQGRSPAWTGWGNDDGVSLVEVLVALVLLATAFVALAQVATSGLISIRAAADRTSAIGYATQAVEAARSEPWEVLGLDDTEHSSLCTSPVTIDEGETVSETVVCVTDGIDEGMPFWGAEGPYVVETYVTAIPGFANARRVTAVVRFDDGAGTQEVRNSTVIAQVQRG